MAAILHDPALAEDPGLVAAVSAAVRLAVENERLTAEVEAQLREVRASRARIVAAGDAERRRVERDLHDGAQQRIVSMTLALRLAQAKLGTETDPAVRESLEQASAEAKAALSELRELARGIHPQILTEAGLAAAVDNLAARAPVAVTVDIDRATRWAPEVESTAYFVVSEALTNVTKYAHAHGAVVRAREAGGMLQVEISDDGVGGADAARGTGLRGLADCLAVVDGTLEVTSPPAGGTIVRARIPTAAPIPA
jgi:signal transduction histidine kinase